MRDPNFIDEQRNADSSTQWLTMTMSYAKPCKKLIHKNGSFTMTKPKQHEDDIIIQIIVIISILITTLLDAIQCLISLNSASSTPNPGKQELLSSDTTLTSSGSTKTQRLSPSTNRRSTTGVQKKVDGITTLDTPASPIASSPRSKQSKSISSTQKSTKSGTSPTSGSRRRTRTTTSVTPTTTPSSIPQNVLTTVETL
jgi:hypothetical protein